MKVDAKGILYLIANRFGLKRDTIEDRLKLQKTVYLLEAFGVQLGYGFSWYKYGPYSQDLVHDAYRVLHSERTKYEKETKSWRFSEDSEKRFGQFRNTCKHIINDADQLELVASVDFVWNVWYEAEGDDFIERFRQHKNTLFSGREVTDKMIVEALELSKQLRNN